MASSSNETMSSQVSSPSTIFNDYLERREQTLSKYHPQWNLTNKEISSSSDLLKRDGTPICIPPSWDLVQKYAGSSKPEASGFDSKTFDNIQCNVLGDYGEAGLMETMRNLSIGGILVGAVSSRDLVNKHKLAGNDEYSLPPILIPGVDFEIDFVYFHPSNGIFHFEVKSGQPCKDDERQLFANRDILRQIFKSYCKLSNEKNDDVLWKKFFCGSSIYYPSYERNERYNNSNLDYPMSSNLIYVEYYCRKFFRKQELEQFCRRVDGTILHKSLFQERRFRDFLIIFAGYRPDYLISPVKCVLFYQRNIFSNRVSTVNYYKKGDDEDKIQNDAKTVTKFLQGLKFVKNVKINFEEYKNIYLTPQQQDAVGVFDEGGNFSPKRQLIFGHPGSGKSLILMLKIFILGQMEKRKEKTVYYWSESGEHRKKLSHFVSRNESKFSREVKELEYKKTVAFEGADVIFDEDWGGYRALSCLSSQHEDQIVALVFTGWWGNATSRNIGGEGSIDLKKFLEFDDVNKLLESDDVKGFIESSDVNKLSESDDVKKFIKTSNEKKFFESSPVKKFFESSAVKKFFESVNMKKFVSLGFLITELQTVFRSTRQIQLFFHKFQDDENNRELISGHNFDGIKVEEWIFDGEEKLKKALDERIRRLIHVEGCEGGEIGLFQPYGYEEPQVIDNIFHDNFRLRSLEFPVMIVVQPGEGDVYLSLSRAVCHLIVFTLRH